MVDPAIVDETEEGLVAKSDGWFVVHTSEVRWKKNPRFGALCEFEGDTNFPQVGVNIRVIQPRQPACLYHAENAQEDFFVLSGECRVLIEDEEIYLKAGHFVHCPAWTRHVFVGAGEGPCVILMIGFRPAKEELLYPVSNLAAKHGASVEEETSDPREAYGSVPVFAEPTDAEWSPE